MGVLVTQQVGVQESGAVVTFSPMSHMKIYFYLAHHGDNLDTNLLVTKQQVVIHFETVMKSFITVSIPYWLHQMLRQDNLCQTTDLKVVAGFSMD